MHHLSCWEPSCIAYETKFPQTACNPPQECPSSPQKLLNRKSWRSHSTSQLISSTFTLTQPHFQQLQQANLIQGFPGALQSILLLGDLHITYPRALQANQGDWNENQQTILQPVGIPDGCPLDSSSAIVNPPCRKPLTTSRLQAAAATFIHP